jgi:hypothetical protein
MVDLVLIRSLIEAIFTQTSNMKVTSFEPISNTEVELKLMIGNDERTILLKIIRTSQPQRIKSILFDLIRTKKDQSSYMMIILPSISNRSSTMIKEAGIGYMDLSGNVYMSFDNILIDRNGNRNDRLERRTLKNIFSPKASRIIRKLLAAPGKEWKIRDLASEAKTSIGLASNEIKRLADEGFVEPKRTSIKLVKPKELLDAWANIYKMDKGCITGFYCPIQDNDSINERLRNISKEYYALTLGSAAMLVAPSVRSKDLYIYTFDQETIIKTLELVPVEFGGNVNLIHPYDDGVLFDRQSIDGLSIVSNIQLYLDLNQYPTRGKEQAEMVRNRLLGY